jgi:succinoglycan biosynthesis protein ExoA
MRGNSVIRLDPPSDRTKFLPLSKPGRLMIVSIVCPCRNEVSHIDIFLRGLMHQQAGAFDLEFLVADGASDDGTAEVLGAWGAREPRLEIVPNPGRIVSTGLNSAIRMARGEIIVRMDVHTEYSEDYVAQCVKAIQQSGAMCVGGPWLAKGKSLRQNAIAAAFGSAFGSGGAKSRRTGYTGFADTVYLGTWRRADLISLGGFDEELVRNQDDELCLRIRRSGGKIWQCDSIRSYYLPRDTLRGLWQQFYEFGYWRAVVIKKHRSLTSARHLAPTLFIGLLLILAISGVFASTAWLLAVGVLTAYIVAAIVAALVARGSYRPANLVVVVLSFACMHFGYGLGLSHGVLDFIILGGTRNADHRIKISSRGRQQS